jgi:hypothetical protein
MEMRRTMLKMPKSQIRNCLQITILILGLIQSALAFDNVLVIRNSLKENEEASKVISQELVEDFIITELLIDSSSSANDVERKMGEVNPKVAILMDNRAVILYKEYQKKVSGTIAIAPSISFMAIYLDQVIKGMKNAIGIRYEIPIVASISNLRYLTNRKINTVGVINRIFMDSLIIQNREFCEKENIQLISYNIPNENKLFGLERKLNKGLHQLLEKEKVDALWVLNDNALLNPEYLMNVWFPLIKKYQNPVIVGVESLVNPDLNFGMYAVLPDHIALCRQVADLVYNIKDCGWKIPNMAIMQPITVTDIANMKKLRQYDISHEKLKKINILLR